MIYASGADLQSINPLVTVHPLAKAVQKHVLFLTLAAYDSNLVPVPRLATWSWNEERTSLAFELRRDIAWHDGVRTWAGDVQMTLELATHPDVAYPRSRDLATVVSVTVLDSFTVEVVFDTPQPIFPDVFTDLAILPYHLLGSTPPGEMRTASYNAHPVGNGPFTFVEHRPNQRWVFRRTAGFPPSLGIPGFERFVVAVVDEPTTKLAALTSGELDFAGITPAHAAFVATDSRLAAIDYPTLFIYGLFWNQRRPPFDQRDVRRALTLALDRQGMIDGYLYGFGSIASGPVGPEHPWYLPSEALPYDPEEAGAILDRLGWRRGAVGIRERNGRRLAATLVTVGSGELALEQMIQAQLKEIGVEIRIRQLELTTFLTLTQSPARDYDAIVTMVPGDLALGHVAALFEGTDGPLAYAGYRSGEFDRAVAWVRAATNAGKLADAWREVQRILYDDHPVTWLYHVRGLQGANRRIEEATPDLRGELATIAGWRVGARGTP